VAFEFEMDVTMDVSPWFNVWACDDRGGDTEPFVSRVVCVLDDSSLPIELALISWSCSFSCLMSDKDDDDDDDDAICWSIFKWGEVESFFLFNKEGRD
jgi:hypothetical protein